VNATAEKFGFPRTLLAEWPRWLVLLRPLQPTLGSVVLVCREPVTRFGAISPQAAAELREVVAAVERALADLLRFDKINYLMLMMVDPDVHFHVLPRYASARRYAGEEFADASWPGPPDLAGARALPDALGERLIEDLRERLAAARSID
jgi:diadenosine tetraphosphate (Ap4A) HIT family hydrolase